MPALPSPGPVLKVQVVWQVGTDFNAMNVLHYSYAGSPPASSDCTAIAAHLFGAPPTAFLGFLPSTTVMTNVIVTDLAGTTGAQGASGGSHPGAGAGQNLTANAAFLLSLKIAARYRGGHPRMYLPPMTTAHLQDPQHWVPADVSTAQTSLTTWLQSLAGYVSSATTVGPQQVVSYYHAKALRATPLVLPITGYVGVERVASQRRRVPR